MPRAGRPCEGAETTDIRVSKGTAHLENGGKLCLWGDFTWQPIRREKTSTTGLQAASLRGKETPVVREKFPMKAVNCATTRFLPFC